MIEMQDVARSPARTARAFRVSQHRIDQFAACTEDHQWIHVDPARAATESSTGGTIAHGYLTLSFLVAAHNQAGAFPEDAVQILNYGLDRVRFIAPVPAGSALRFEIKTIEVVPRGEHELMRTKTTAMLEGSGTSVAVAEALFLIERRRP